MKKKKISLAMTAYNEEGSLPLLLEQIQNILVNQKTQYDFEVVICDNGSQDNTLKVIQDLQQKHPFIKFVKLTRNFQHQGGLLAALDHCYGDAIVMLDADGQHPVKEITNLIQKWEEGYKIVNTTKIRNSFGLKSQIERLFYYLMYKLTDMNLGQADFRLIDKVVLKNLQQMPERQKFIRGIMSWQGFKETKIKYHVEKRLKGKSKFSISNLFDFAFQGITSFSTKPLRLVVKLGFIMLIPSSLVLIWHVYIGIKVFFLKSVAQFPPGWLTLSVVTMFFGSIQLLSLGIIGEYVGRIYIEVKGRPYYIIDEEAEHNE